MRYVKTAHAVGVAAKKRAFTLVELLVVIAIIGMLAALITSASTAALRYARVAVVKTEMSQIVLALEQYKIKYGEYPPDFSDYKAVVRHVKKRWARFGFLPASTNSELQYQEFCERIWRSTGWNPAEIGWASGNIPTTTQQQNFAYGGALAFWLGGLPDNAVGTQNTSSSGNALGFTRLDGFSTNPADPFDTQTVDSGGNIKENPREKPLVEFEVGKNLAVFSLTPNNNDNVFPVVWAGNGMVAYFKSNLGGQESVAYYLPDTTDVKSLWNINQYQADGFGYKFSRHANAAMEKFYPGIAVPYMKDNATVVKWYEPKGFQLVHPGLDGRFGAWSELGGAYGSCTIQGTNTPPDATNVSRTVVLGGSNSGSGITQYDEDNIIYNGELTTVKEALP